jgi:eukaryotic-like serine/threonine-protein kinase
VLEVGKLIHDRYALISPIREGRTAALWRANDQKLRREVAIKFMFGDDGPDPKPGMDAFLREARAAASIQHRNVIHTVDCGLLDERQAFMVMELLNGEHLGERMAREPRLGPGPFIHIITVTLRGLAAVHDAGVVHRDLKPENIFLQRDTDTSYPKIVGFGISPRTWRPSLRPSAVGDGSSVGTPHYMSPEQARGQSGIDKRSDVYSMAVILFQGLSGRLPFDAVATGELIAKIATEAPPQLREFCPELPEPLSDLLVQAMSKDRDHRFADARAMRNAILSAAKTLLPTTRPSSTSLTPIAAAADPRGTALGVAHAVQQLSGRAGWGDFEGLTRPAAPAATSAAPVGEPAPAEPDAAPAKDAARSPRPPPGRRASAAQLRGATRPSSQQLPAASVGSAAQPTSKRSSAVQLPAVAPAVAVQSQRTSVAERRDKAMPGPAAATRNSIERARVAAESTAAQSSAESSEPSGADALDPLYAGADQAAPEIDFERIRSHTKKATVVRVQPTAAQAGQAPSRVGNQGGKPPGPDSATSSPGVARRTWVLSLIAVAAVGLAYVAAGGLGSPAEPGVAADPRGTPETSSGVDEDLRKLRLEVKARRHNPGHMLPHLRDVEF